jgi:23S rRNA (uracil1939-C5)-methyltransferase
MPPAAPRMTVSITAIADQGDGVATVGAGKLFVPFTVPGDRVDVIAPAGTGGGGHARVSAWHARGPRRQEAPCPHFGRCGGCALQHLEPAFYREWKLARIMGALARAGIQTPVMAPLAETPPGARRRAELAACRHGRVIALGFHERLAHEIAPIERCPVMQPALVALLPALRDLLVTILPADGEARRRTLDLLLTATDSGIDLVLKGLAFDARAQLALREHLAAFAAAHDLARIALAPARGEAEVVAARRSPRIMLEDVAVELPPGAFLQASLAGERAIRAAVHEGLGAALDGGARIADLYAGCGTLSLPLARGAHVHAVEGEKAMAAALDAAARRAGLGPKVSVEIRDLARRPLRAEELARFDAVVLDPPRNGAAAQAAALAQAKPPIVVSVSCNPVTFARDAATLVAGGYRLTRVTPVDQFLWSPQLEVVGVFARP